MSRVKIMKLGCCFYFSEIRKMCSRTNCRWCSKNISKRSVVKEQMTLAFLPTVVPCAKRVVGVVAVVVVWIFCSLSCSNFCFLVFMMDFSFVPRRQNVCLLFSTSGSFCHPELAAPSQAKPALLFINLFLLDDFI